MALLGGKEPVIKVLHDHGVRSPDKRRVTINILPDDVLLHIFLFDRVRYLEDVDRLPVLHQSRRRHFWRWRRLVRVCRRWRSVVFGSPKFLDLRLVCGPRTRVKLTGIWPPLPIIVTDAVNPPIPRDYDFGAAIMHHNRVCEIDLRLTRSQLLRLASAMQVKFPALIHLKLDFAGFHSYPDPAPALPDGFLGGSAARLQTLELHSIPFPALPKLLLSATDLVRLTLLDIPHSGHISPEVIVTSLAALANLRSLTIEFKYTQSRPNWEHRSQPPLTLARTVLPALTRFEFLGVVEYLEDLVARIDAPFLDSISTTFFYRPIFNTPQLAQFMRRTARFETADEAHVNTGHYSL